MSLPTDVATVTVSGTFANSDGSACQGTVEFVPGACRWVDGASNVTIAARPVRATLDGSGAFTTELVATDDADLSPSAWSYRCRVRLSDCDTAISFDMTAPSGPPINLSEKIPTWS